MCGCRYRLQTARAAKVSQSRRGVAAEGAPRLGAILARKPCPCKALALAASKDADLKIGQVNALRRLVEAGAADGGAVGGDAGYRRDGVRGNAEGRATVVDIDRPEREPSEVLRGDDAGDKGGRRGGGAAEADRANR